MSNDFWRTPDWLYNYCNALFGPFDVDLAASETNAKCASFIDAGINALTAKWIDYGTNGFSNPPYSNLPPWLRSAMLHQARYRFPSTWVLPTFNGETHWLDNAYRKAASHVINICGRVAFLDSLNIPIKGNRQGTQIIHYGLAIPDTPQILYVKRDTIIAQYTKP